MQNPKGARLRFKKRNDGSPSTFIIIDGRKQLGTGCGRDRLEDAQKALAHYIQSRYRPNTRQSDLAQIGCADVIGLVATEVAPALPSAATIGYQGGALLKFWSDKTLAQVKGATCRAYVIFRTAQKLKTREGEEQRFVSPATARQELKLLGRAINHWHRESPLVAVPRVTLPAVVSKRERVLSRNEVARLLWAARKLKFTHVARFILIGVYTGTRHQAILQLRWESSLVGGHADIERGVIYRRGSAERETSKRRPAVNIPLGLLAHLKSWTKCGRGGTIVHLKGQPIAKMKRAWATVVRAAGLGPDVTPHVLRHTCASWLLWQGKTIWEVAGIIGADASTVERTYGHHQLLQDERKRA